MCASTCKHKRYLMALLKYELNSIEVFFFLKKSNIKTHYNSISEIKMQMFSRMILFSCADLIYTIVWKSSTSTVNSDSQKHVDGPADPCTTITPHTPSNAAWWTAQLPAVYQISCVSIFSIDQIGTIMTGAHVQILVGSYNSSINSKM